VHQIAGVLSLHALLATYPGTAALKEGRLHSDLVSFDFADVRQAHTRFKSLVRDELFDVGELAIVTYLQARASGKPYVLMPAVIVARGQHQSLVYNPARGHLEPDQLEGRRVGVRAYTQTTGAWIRGILQDEYGVDPARVEWMTFEEPHVAEFIDPPWVVRAGNDKQLLQTLIDGEIEAAIFGNELPDAPMRPLIPDPEAAAADWSARTGVHPINHMAVVRESIAREHPEVVREVYRLLAESRGAALNGNQAIRFGVEANRRSLERIIEYSLRQGLIPRRLSVDELFDDVTRALGAP